MKILIIQFIVEQGWVMWKESELLGETESAFKIKTFFGTRWLSKKYFKYQEIK